MNMKVENEMALPITKSVTVMLLEPYAGNSLRTVLRGESSRKGLTYSTRAATRHVEDRRELVRRVYFPDCRRDDPTLFLLVVQPVMQIIMEYGINKGIGKSVEFRGLKAQYLFIFAGGLLAVFVVFVILYMAGVDQWVCIAFGVAAASVLVWLTFRLNAVTGNTG